MIAFHGYKMKTTEDVIEAVMQHLISALYFYTNNNNNEYVWDAINELVDSDEAQWIADNLGEAYSKYER